MFEHFILAIVITLSAAFTASRVARRAVSGHYSRVILASLLSACGVFLAMFVIGGYGWGRPGLDRTEELNLLLIGGNFLGFFYSVFAWLASQRLYSIFLVALVVTDGFLALIPSSIGVYGVLLFSAVNFLLLFVWLRNAYSTESLSRGA